MKCKKCNAEIPNDSRFCVVCGIKIEKTPESPGKKVISDRHYSLEDIARQQEGKGTEIGVGTDVPEENEDQPLPPIGTNDSMRIEELLGPKSHSVSLAKSEPENHSGNAPTPVPDLSEDDNTDESVVCEPVNARKYESVGAAVPSMNQKQIVISLF